MSQKINEVTVGKNPGRPTTIRHRKGIVINNKFLGRGDASPDTEISKGDGLILNSLKVNLIFWGKTWTSGNKRKLSYTTICNDIKQILSGSYISGLRQYGVSSTRFNKFYLYDETDPPDNFSERNVVGLIKKMIKNGSLLNPDEDRSTFHCVIMPPKKFSNRGRPAKAAHFARKYPGCTNKLHLAWLRFGTQSFISRYFSHELVEVCTDAEGDGVRIVPHTKCKDSGWCEIADVCKSTQKVNCVTLHSYWSEQDAACIIPMESGVRK